MARSDMILQAANNEDSEVTRNIRVIRKQAEKITSAIEALSECRRNEIVSRRSTRRIELTEL